MQINIVNNYQNDQNCYIVSEGDKAFVIDPGSNSDKIIEKANELGVKITDILITHCHYDHIIGVEGIREKTGAKLWATGECNKNAQDTVINLTSFAWDEPIKLATAEHIVSDGEEFEVCGIKVKCITTPGHTSCSTCFQCGDVIFSGDTVFLRCVGRHDLPTGNEQTLAESVRNKLYTLDDNIVLYPGHGRETTVGYEKKFNLVIKEK